jgi:PIN domain nuclease of toxin-antitoxin system
VTAVNLGESLDVLSRHMGWPLDEVEEKLRWLIFGGLEVIEIDEQIGLEAGRLHAVHYHRTQRPLSLADCIALAAAAIRAEPLATADPALVATAAEISCAVVQLPDARGLRP